MDHSCARAITQLILCVEDAHSHEKDIVLRYIDINGHSLPWTINN